MSMVRKGVGTGPWNALTVDVEDYFHVSAFEKRIDRKDWDRHPLRVERNTRIVLDLLDCHSVKGTFFVLGWVAERCRNLVAEIRNRGHEVACHGYGHQLVYAIGPVAFREDVRKAKALLEDVSGGSVDGYRAPSFSITSKSLWALDILVEEGFAYDSSIFPVYHDLYGMRDAEPYPNAVQRSAGSIIEFPMSTLPIAVGKRTIVRLPFSGGGYLRLLPLWFVRKAFDRINGKEGRPVVLYFHPWEIDTGQPRIRAGMKSEFRHYHNIAKVEGKLGTLLSSYRFAPMKQVLGL